MTRPNVGERAGYDQLEVLHEFEFDGDAKEVYEFILWGPRRKRPRVWQTQWTECVVRFEPRGGISLDPPPGVLFTLEVLIAIRWEQPRVGEPYCRELEHYEAARHETTRWPLRLMGYACKIWLFQSRPGCCEGQIALLRDMERWREYGPFAGTDFLEEDILAIADIAMGDGAARFWGDIISAWSKRQYSDVEAHRPQEPNTLGTTSESSNLQPIARGGASSSELRRRTRPLGGRPPSPDDDWAFRQIEAGRPVREVYREWVARPGVKERELMDPRDSFNHAMRTRRKKQKKPE